MTETGMPSAVSGRLLSLEDIEDLKEDMDRALSAAGL